MLAIGARVLEGETKVRAGARQCKDNMRTIYLRAAKQGN